MKNTLLFICSANILVRLLTVNMKNQCLSPQNPKMCDPIPATLLKMRPHYSQSISENATPSSGTSPLASYKEVPPPPRAVKLLRSYKRPKFTSPQLFARYQRVICLLSVSSWCFEKAIDYKATFTPLSRVRSYSSPRRAGSQAYTLSTVKGLLTRKGGGGVG